MPQLLSLVSLAPPSSAVLVNGTVETMISSGSPPTPAHQVDRGCSVAALPQPSSTAPNKNDREVDATVAVVTVVAAHGIVPERGQTPGPKPWGKSHNYFKEFFLC